MATRQVSLKIRNSNIPNRPLPSSLNQGEAIVNLADGILYFSGNSLSTNNWVPSPLNSNFFEVGSNIYNLQIRNQITSYSGLTNLNGQFLSGTTNGFVLAPISAIAGVDTYVTGFTYSNNTLTIYQNQNKPVYSVLINTMTGLTINGVFSATTENISTSNITTLGATGATISTLNATTENIGTSNIVTLGASGATINILSANTLSATTTNINKLASYNGLTNVNGQFLSGTTSGFTLASISAITGIDTYVTGFTYNSAQNQLTISQNQSQPNLSVFITSVSGLTVSNLTANRLVYTTTGGLLTTGTAIFDGTNMTLPAAGSLSVGTGGLVVGSGGSYGVPGTGDVVINGNLTVFGSSISAFTSHLYVEDPFIILNYNPTGTTSGTSIGSGIAIQDGSGISGSSVNFVVEAMNGFTGLTASQVPSVTEYSGSIGYSNRAFVTQLNDIVIRSTSINTPNGIRVLGEFDTLDGGGY